MRPITNGFVERLSNAARQGCVPFPYFVDGVCKHVRILERAGLVRRTPHGRENTLALSGPLQQVADWVLNYEQFWNLRMDRRKKFFVAKKEKSR